MSLDFSDSAAQRHRRALRAVGEQVQPSLFASWTANIDVHLQSATEAVATVSGPQPERAHQWLAGVVGSIHPVRTRRILFDVTRLDRLAWVRPPAQVTLDAAATAVAKALWAHALGYPPLRVSRTRSRLLASSGRGTPAGLRVCDAPWTAIVALVAADVPLRVDAAAQALLARRLGQARTPIASVSLAGSALLIDTTHPDMVERLNLPGLAYDGAKGTGRYKVPLLLGRTVISSPVMTVPDAVHDAVMAATRRPTPVRAADLGERFPWTLYGFQATDAARALQIVRHSGGVLLAGDMGSGKTTVALALAQILGTWPLLIVAPLSAFSTWERQLRQMGRRAYVASGSPKAAWEALVSGSFEAVVLSYDRLPALAEAVEAAHFAAVIADEVQRIRSPSSRRSRALRALAGAVPIRIGLSGTPITNTIRDALPVGAFLVPGEWKPRASVRDLSDVYPGDPVESLADHLGSLMVRRRMADVAANLPKRHDHRVMVSLTSAQLAALADLQRETAAAKEAGVFADPQGRMHAFARLQKMRAIVNAPGSAGVPGPSPKVTAAVDLACDFLNEGRKGVIFCADRYTFVQLGRALDAEGIGWVGIWGSTPARDRIEAERRFHTDPRVKVVVCTIQAGSESWSASPTATWLISTAYMYSPSSLAQMEARVYRMNSDPDGPDVQICYMHAQVDGGSLDDRMVEIVEDKKHLFAQVVDRCDHVDTTKVHLSMGDLMFLLTGEGSPAGAAEDPREVVEARDEEHGELGESEADVDFDVDDGDSDPGH